jgi:ferredoxin-thioredoxin reductase catalytic subunit
MSTDEMDEAEVDRIYTTIKREAEDGGYHLNPDTVFVRALVQGLIRNERRYGYRACPCRLASGKMEEDLDIICPCDYRDPDLDDFGACYCALYVTDPVLSGQQKLTSIPERRPSRSERKNTKSATHPGTNPLSSLPYPVWRCKVCGYLCAREQPPGVCPICKVKKDRFERFI